MVLIKDDRIVEDPWVAVADEAALPSEDQAVIVSYGRFERDRAALLARRGGLGVRLESDQPPGLITTDLDDIELVALVFPKFTDGRPFSSARLLRERYGFKGELRAVGDVLCDQWAFLRRCGFDSVEVESEAAARDWLGVASDFSVSYQPAADGRPWAARLRAARRRGARLSAAE